MKKNDIFKQYNLIGPKYIAGQKSYFSDHEDEARRFIKKCLPSLKGKVVLDIGCGHGEDIKLFQKLKAKSIYGIDSSKVMINEARKNVHKCSDLAVAEIEKTSFQDNFFDVVVGRFALHYIDYLGNAYKELARIIKPSGHLVFIVHHPLRDFVKKQNKNYRKREIVTTYLYENKVPISFPTHIFSDYFSKEFFRYFYIDDFIEEESPEECPAGKEIPGFMGVKAIRR